MLPFATNNKLTAQKQPTRSAITFCFKYLPLLCNAIASKIVEHYLLLLLTKQVVFISLRARL